MLEHILNKYHNYQISNIDKNKKIKIILYCTLFFWRPYEVNSKRHSALRRSEEALPLQAMAANSEVSLNDTAQIRKATAVNDFSDTCSECVLLFFMHHH